MMALSLLPAELLVRTGEVDHADWNYSPGLLGFVSRQRFRLVASLLPRQRVGKLLEVGYGSGVMFPELAKHAEHLYGVDVHESPREVTAALAKAGIAAELSTAPAEKLPFADETFDAVVAISTFEFVSDVAAAAAEIARVLRPSGCAVIVTPGTSALLDFALRAFTGESADKDFGDRRKLVVPGLKRGLRYERSARFPEFAPLTVYRALRFRRPA